MTVAERLKKAFGITDEKKLNEILADEAESATKTETHIHVHTRDEEETEEEKKDDDKEKKTHDALKSIVADAVQPIKDSIKSLDERMSKFEDAKEDEPGKKDDEDDKEKYDDEKTKDAVRVEIELTPKVKTKDSAALEDSFNEALALAEVISPGISAPTFDSAQPAAKTAESICQFRRKVLDKAAADQPEVKQFMDGVINGRDFKTYDCAGVKTVFQAVGVFKKQANNSVRDGMKFGTDTGKVRSIAELNKQNREFYGANKA